MSILKKYNIRVILLNTMWVLLSACAVVILVSAVHVSDKKLCKGLEVHIHGVSNNFFIDKVDVRNVITSYAGNNITEIETDAFNLQAMEAELKKEVWIKNAELYFDNNRVLQASVEEREPIARVFSGGGSSFYIDNSLMILPISDKISARLPVFTSFPTDARVLSKTDSLLLKDVRKLSMLIQKDSFLMAMIEQVDITAKRGFEMIPKIGDQLIVFGDASDAEQKFAKLQLFYKKVMPKYGWNRYSIISLHYKNQVVGKLKGKDDVSADSLRTVEIMHAIAINAARAASDSLQTIVQDNEKNTTSVSIIEQSMEREDESLDVINPFQNRTEETVPTASVDKPLTKHAPVVKKPAVKIVKPAVKPVQKPTVKPVQPKAVPVKPATKPVTKPAIKPASKPGDKPKIIMPPKNDY